MDPCGLKSTATGGCDGWEAGSSISGRRIREKVGEERSVQKRKRWKGKEEEK